MKLKGKNIHTNYLTLLGVRYTESFSDKYFNEHPHKYNLLGISNMLRVLRDYGIKNAAIQISDKENDISLIDTPFIAQFGDMYRIFQKLFYNFSISNLAIFFLISCTHPGQKNEGGDSIIPKIDIIGNISKVQKVNLSSIASSIEYCMLETDEKCLIRDNSIIYSSGGYFVYMSHNSTWPECYIFERKNGKFVRQISQVGQGPNDYKNTISVLDGDKGQICLAGNNQLLFFNLDGTLSHKTKLFAYNFLAYEDFYVLSFYNTRGNAKIRIAFYDNKTGELVDSIPNDRQYVRTTQTIQTNIDYSFHLFNNSLYYKDIYCDTLYQINDFTLLPRYIFSTGGLTVPYKSQNEGRFDVEAAMAGRENDRYAKYIVINRFFESEKYLFFTFDYTNRKYPVIFNKSEDEIHIMHPVSLPLLYLRNLQIPLFGFGFENDLDGGLPFWPKQMISEKEMMCVYTAEELLALDRTKMVGENLKNLLNILEEDSNPVVAIVTIKD